MFPYIAARAAQALFLLTPQSGPHRPPQRHVKRLENPHHFHHHSAARSIVGGAGSTVPGIEMGAQHDQFAALPRSGDLGNHVLPRLLRENPGIDIHFENNGLTSFQQAMDAIVVFRHERD